MRHLLTFLLLLSLSNGKSQTATGNLNEQEKENFKTLLDAVSFLKSKPNFELGILDSTVGRRAWKYYESFFNKYYDPNALHDNSKGQMFQNRLMASLILNNIDWHLDVLPPDSIHVRPARLGKHYVPGDSLLDRAFEIFYLVDGKEFPPLHVLFDGSGKMFAIVPTIAFEKQYSGINIKGFMRRQKGYSNIERKLYREW